MKHQTYPLFAAIVGIILSTSGWAQTPNTFIGPVTGQWDVPGNWSLGTIPTSTNDVFMGGTSIFSNVTNSFTINSLSIADSGAGGSGVVVTGPAGNVNNTGATTIGSGSSGTSYLQLNNAVAVVSTASMDLTGDGNTQIRFAAGTINVGGGSGSITDTGAGTSALRIQGTSGLPALCMVRTKWRQTLSSFVRSKRRGHSARRRLGRCPGSSRQTPEGYDKSRGETLPTFRRWLATVHVLTDVGERQRSEGGWP